MAIHQEKRGKTDRDRDVGIFQSFTDEVSPNTRNVGILVNSVPITIRKGKCGGAYLLPKYHLKPIDVNPVAHIMTAMFARTTSSPFPVSSPARTRVSESSPPLPSVAPWISVAKKQTAERTR
jgi:hypothetical protein